MRRSDLGDYTDACIVVKGRISVKVLMMLTKEVKANFQE